MKTIINALQLFAIVSFIMLFSSEIDAQSRHGRGYGYYYRPHVSIGIGYNPYYNYRPVLRPRIYYHPPYRLPYRYNHFGPAFGLRIGILPFGYSQFFLGNDPYYYYDGIYYRPYASGGYTVTAPPLGAMVKRLPSGAKVTVIDGQKYYELGGTFYQERITANNKTRYEVVGTDGVLNTTNADTEEDDNDAAQSPAAAQNNNSQQSSANAVIDELPAGCTTVVINRQKYFVSPAGVYYQEVNDGKSGGYKVAGNATPSTRTDSISTGTL